MSQPSEEVVKTGIKQPTDFDRTTFREMMVQCHAECNIQLIEHASAHMGKWLKYPVIDSRRDPALTVEPIHTDLGSCPAQAPCSWQGLAVLYSKT